MKKQFLIFFIISLFFVFNAHAVSISIIDDSGTVISETTPSPSEVAAYAENSTTNETDTTKKTDTAKDAFINDIINLGEKLYKDARGRAQRAQYSGDIYVCKNFTVHLFNKNKDNYRLSDYPDTKLVIPNNKPKDEMVNYVYGVEWETIEASNGNPFEVAASFRYNSELSKEENKENARNFLMQVQKGDYFQMAAKYYYGIGAHSLIFTRDYVKETDSVFWMDSNMKGESKNGERYGYVQFDAEKNIDWFVDAFCKPKYGATLYRLSDNLINIQ